MADVKEVLRALGTRVKRNNWGFFIIFSFCIYLLLGYFGAVPLITIIFLNVFLALLLWFLVDKEERDLTFIITVFVLSVMPAVMAGYFPSLNQNAFFYFYILNPIVAMWWTYYAIIASPDQGLICWFAKRALLFYVIGIMLSFMLNAGYFDDYKIYLTPEQRFKGIQLFKMSYQSLVKSLSLVGTSLKTGVVSWWNQRIGEATGDYYVGRVEQNTKEQLGIYLVNVKPATATFYDTEPVAVWGSMKGKTLGDTVRTTNRCYLGERKESGFDGPEGKMYPNTSQIYDFEQIDLDCSFDPGIAKIGSNYVTFVSDFNFETMAYIKRYFIDKSRLRAMSRQRIDPLDNYKITDKNPTAVYTNGPVQLGMSKMDDVALIGVDDLTTVLVGVTIEKNPAWKGGIKEIKSLVIQVPAQFELSDPNTDCNFAFVKYDVEACVKDHIQYNSIDYRKCGGTEKNTEKEEIGWGSDVEGCLQDLCRKELEGYNAYAINPQHNPDSLKNVKTYKTFYCRFKLKDKAGLLGNVPISTKYYRASARYIYSVEELTMVVVKEDPTHIIQRENAEYYQKQVPSSAEGMVTWIYQNYNLQKYKSEVFSDCGMAALIAMESSGNPYASSKESTSKGLLQFIAGTAFQYGLCDNKDCTGRDDRLNPEKSIEAGYNYINDINNKIAKYNIHPADREKVLITGFFLGDGCVIKILESIGQKQQITWSDMSSAINMENMRKCFPSQTDTWRSNAIQIVNRRIQSLDQYSTLCQKNKDSLINVTIKQEVQPEVIERSETIQKGKVIELNEIGLKINVSDVVVQNIQDIMSSYYLNYVILSFEDAVLNKKNAYSLKVYEGEEKTIEPYKMIYLKVGNFVGSEERNNTGKNTATLTIKTIKNDFVVNTGALTSSTSYNLKELFQVKYLTGSIVVYDSTGSVVCTVPWSLGIPATCQKSLPGVLRVVNLAGLDNWREKGYAQVQLQYYPKARVENPQTIPKEAHQTTSYQQTTASSLDGQSV
ncbi:MAG: transglycosylase SLT domain-containing protein [Candidatus Woesearchaeota archaeon]